MLEAIKKLLGIKPKADYAQLFREGAIILDVRSKGEFSGGHVEKAINIPLDQLGNNLKRFKDKDACIICCCASGMRSGSAAGILKSKGYTRVYNGGGWRGLNSRLLR